MNNVPKLPQNPYDGMEIIDCGPPVLSMHSPFEIAHKGDLYMTYKGFRSFLEAKGK